MKSFVSLCLAVGFAALSHAASIAWGSADPLAKVSLSPAGGSLSEYVAYLCVGGSSVAESTLSEIRAGSWSAPTIGNGDTAISKNLTSAGVVDSSNSTLLGSSFNAGGTYDFFLVIFDKDAENVMISSVVQGTPYDEGAASNGTKVVWTADQLSGTTGGWVLASDVPEPTVLALLALGIVGLALKRKVA